MHDASAIPNPPSQANVPAANLEAGRAVARALGVAVEDKNQLELAQAFCWHVVAAWWQSFTADGGDCFSLRPLLRPLDLPSLPVWAKTLAHSMGNIAAQSDVEAAAYQIGLTYTRMLSTDYKSRLGVYYTPPVLTTRLLDQATEVGVDWTRCRVLDPACGGGAFLAPIGRRILEALPDCNPRILVNNIATRLCGYEIDPFAAWLSQVTLDAIFLPVCNAAHCRLPVVVVVCDSLKRPPPSERFDLVVGNPPYGRVTLEPAIRKRYQRSLYGHANLYGLFTDLGLRHTKPGGVIAYVTPTSFLAGQYFNKLRGILGHEAPPATVDFVTLRKGIFEDVLQETMLATYRRGAEPTTAAVYQVTPTNVAGLKIETAGTFRLPAEPSQPWLLPRVANQAKLVATLNAMPHRLADWGYTVSTGPLVWNRHKNQLTHLPGKGRLPLLWAEAVAADGRFVWRAEKKNHTPYFEPCHGDDWLITRNPCVLLQRTTAREQSRRLIAAALPLSFLTKYGAVVIENHLNMLRPIVENPSVALAVLAAFLNSAAADQAFRCVSGSVAVSAFELKALPLPPPQALTELTDLVRKGANRADIEATCARLYAPKDKA